MRQVGLEGGGVSLFLLSHLTLSSLYQSLYGVNTVISRTRISLRMQKKKREGDGLDAVVSPDAFHV